MFWVFLVIIQYSSADCDDSDFVYDETFDSDYGEERETLFGKFMPSFGDHYNNFFEVRKSYYTETYGYNFCYLRSPKDCNVDIIISSDFE